MSLPRGADGARPALPLGRRGLLLAAAALLSAPLPAAARSPAPAAPWLATIAARVGALHGAGLLRSYDVAGNGAFDQAHGNCAYVYDNAAAGLALLAGGFVAEARRIGDALAAAQAKDRFWRDGRLRNAYAAGDAPASGPYPLPGWWDAAQNTWLEDGYQVGTGPGVMAWAMLLWTALFRTTAAPAYREAASRAADWVEHAVRVPAGYGGGFLGWEPSPARLGWVSTEHNLDLSVAFAGLGRAEAAAHAGGFVARMWHDDEARFDAGLTPSGAVNPHRAADANLWPLLTPGAPPAWAAARAATLAAQGVPVARPDGIDYNADRDGIWLEGTAYLALAAWRAGDAALAGRMLATLRAQTSPAGMVWACSGPVLTTGLSTGLQDAADFVYYRRPHLGATAWAALALLRASPFTG